MKIGDYVVLTDGEIGRIIDISGDTISTDVGSYKSIEVENFDTELYKIIQAGDFINGAKVYGSKQKPGLYVNGNNIKYADIKQVQTEKKFYKNNYNVSNMESEWKVIHDFPEYEISVDGFVRVIKTGKVLSTGREGIQPSARLTRNGKRYRKNVARLMLETFVCVSDLQVPAFKDGNVMNVRLDNLYWTDPVVPEKKKRGRKPERSYKYNNIVGYYNNKPVIAGPNTVAIAKRLSSVFNITTKSINFNVNKSVREGTAYKNIFYKVTDEEEYSNIRLSIDDNIEEFYKQIKEEQDKVKAEKENKHKESRKKN